MNGITIKCDSLKMTDEQFFQLCQDNQDLRFERNQWGDLIIMPPAGGETGNRNIEIAYQLQAWNRKHNLGIAFDSSTGFKLPNGAERSPDAAWIPLEKWNSLNAQERQQFPPLSPDFVIELLSPSDTLKATQEKMQEYLANGTSLGWLINRKSRQVEIYRQGQEVEVLDNPETLSGEDVLKGFVLYLEHIW